MAPAGARPRGRPPANKVSKTAAKPSMRRLSDRISTAVRKTDERMALAEKAANARPTTQAVAEKPGRGRPKRVPATAVEDDEEDEEVPERAQQDMRRRVVNNKAKVTEIRSHEAEIPETQQHPTEMELDTRDDTDGDFLGQDSIDLPALPRHHVVLPSPAAPRVAGYSSPERGDAALRRRLGDMTKKYESLQLRYKDLRDVAVGDAERNFDKLKKETDHRADAAKQLVATLKVELSHQRELARAAATTQKRLEDSEATVQDLRGTVKDLERSLSEAMTEIKSLKAKLSATRSGEPAGARGLAGAVNGSGRPGGFSDTQVASSQAAQMKEDLYGDLTGLIVRGVKKDANEDVFDCIQTGRNGTLHFKLAISNDNTSSDFNEAQFVYMPQLDSNRDGELVDLLPDFLVEEITFPRPHAAKFYARVMRALTERID